jgi:hypothetical protein
MRIGRNFLSMNSNSYLVISFFLFHFSFLISRPHPLTPIPALHSCGTVADFHRASPLQRSRLVNTKQLPQIHVENLELGTVLTRRCLISHQSDPGSAARRICVNDQVRLKHASQQMLCHHLVRITKRDHSP